MLVNSVSDWIPKEQHDACWQEVQKELSEEIPAPPEKEVQKSPDELMEVEPANEVEPAKAYFLISFVFTISDFNFNFDWNSK